MRLQKSIILDFATAKYIFLYSKGMNKYNVKGTITKAMGGGNGYWQKTAFPGPNCTHFI